jgi:hypothetical protein
MKFIAIAGWLLLAVPGLGRAQNSTAYRVLTAIRAEALQKEMQGAAAAGFRFTAVSGDTTLSEGKNVVVVMRKDPSFSGKREYRVVATTKTSAVQELQEASDAGFTYLAQTVFTGPLHFREAAVLLERDPSAQTTRYQYRLLVTHRATTMQEELQTADREGYEIAGLTVGSSVIGVNDIVAVLRRTVSQ